ncbi:hypothetical protein T07_13270 [Trichinella nelsoni]|uniref:Uncharacterized protein n=1 Tax=Trichinella nelsoni TaxID=6336 RepID=A0A0V0RTG5_9BILA|nr:hypothetical protein T07_13270 [Trichinella nelsoni]
MSEDKFQMLAFREYRKISAGLKVPSHGGIDKFDPYFLLLLKMCVTFSCLTSIHLENYALYMQCIF